jgi:DNA-binding NtrC family response regulator
VDGHRTLLVLAPPGTDRDGHFRELSECREFEVRFSATAAEAERALTHAEVALLIAAPEVPTTEVNQLLASKARHRPDLPVLVIRNRQAEEPAGWTRRGVGVLRCPLLPTALSRSVDVVLGLGAGR